MPLRLAAARGQLGAAARGGRSNKGRYKPCEMNMF
jgi:hypothetical protein